MFAEICLYGGLLEESGWESTFNTRSVKPFWPTRAEPQLVQLIFLFANRSVTPR